MNGAFAPIKTKCIWWRELPVDDDIWDTRLKESQKRLRCTCFVEGKAWTVERGKVPQECPDQRHCRYYIKHM